MKSYQEKIFGPVLQIVRAETFEKALSYPNMHHQGNAVSDFTRDGDAAKGFVAEAGGALMKSSSGGQRTETAFAGQLLFMETTP